MCYTGLVKRIIPFALTFAVGLFIASFFVSLTFPGVRWRSERRMNRFHEMQQLRMDNDDLREKCRSLRRENEELRRSVGGLELVIPDAVPPVDLEEHKPPTPPKRPKQPRFE
jgi:hypothetical protein